MKRIPYLLFLSLLYGSYILAQAPSNGQNYVMETLVRDSGIMTLSQLNTLPVSGGNRSVQYFDGLGRPMQRVQWQASPQMKDVVLHIEYDGLGRESRKYLPYVSAETNASYKTGANNNVYAYYNNPSITDIVRTAHPYMETVFENSPLNRIQEQGAAGETWQPYNNLVANSGHTVKTIYGTNVAGDVRYWFPNAAGADGTNTYLPGRLYRTTTKDENWEGGKTGTVEELRLFRTTGPKTASISE